jgi:hypothetical protein
MINETISLCKSAILSSMVVISTLFKHGRAYVELVGEVLLSRSLFDGGNNVFKEELLAFFTSS